MARSHEDYTFTNQKDGEQYFSREDYVDNDSYSDRQQRWEWNEQRRNAYSAPTPTTPSWFSRHKFLTFLLILFGVQFVPAIVVLIFYIIGALSYSLLIIGAAGLIAWGSVKLFDAVKDSSGKRKTEPVTKNWKPKDSFVPEAMLDLAKDRQKEAVIISSSYDSMMKKVGESGGDTEIVAAQYKEQMDAMASVISTYEKVRKNKADYPDADDLTGKYKDAVEALLRQFRETIKHANENAVDDATIAMNSIIHSTTEDLSEDK